MNKREIRKLVDLCDAGEFLKVERSARKAIKKNPKDAVAYKALGTALEKLGKKKPARDAMEKSLKLNPFDAQSWFNFGNQHKEIGNHDMAVHCYQKAIILKLGYAEAYNNLGNTLKMMGRNEEALKAFWTGVRLAPHLVDIQLNWGNLLFAVGRHSEAKKAFECAIAIDKEFIPAHNAMIFVMDLEPDTTPQMAYDERVKWAKQFADPLWQDSLHPNDPDPDRKLRIGYVSGDFREHSAARVFGGMLLEYDKKHFEVFCYSNSKHPPDEYTKHFKGAVHHWRDVSEMGDAHVADVVRADEIDILMDLSGHTGGNRLLSFARRPAPIQGTAWGYVTGTGMKAMDFMFADPVLIPPDEQKYYAEKLVYLPSYGGCLAGQPFPDVSELPALSGDKVIAFGSLNRMAKMTPEGFQLWADVLRAVPNSGIIIKAGELADQQSRDGLLEHFTRMGLDAGRFIIRGGSPWEDHMATYREIDICLDTFPQTGGATTTEALMMGVPVITLRTPTCAGRPSSALLTAVGLTDWIAETPADYVRLAAEKAADLTALAALRKGMRERFLASPVGDNKLYCRAVETEYRRMWREWCASKVVDMERAVA